MSTGMQWHFGAFRLDPTHACLWRGEDVLGLPPKPFAVLQYLVTHPDRLVTTAELLDAVWPATAVSATVVRIAIGAVRHVLGDPAQTPRYIATVPRRGYRFLVPVTWATVSGPHVPEPPLPSGPAPLLVERETVLQQLQRALGHAQQGVRQVVVVTGEPGIGKTAVVDTFTAQAATRTSMWVAHGQCVEAYGPGEAYRPILEALGALCRGQGGAHLGALLRQQAPTWVAQMPWLLTAAQRAQVHDALQGTTRERMLREGAEVLDTLTTERPLVLVLEDLHWSDAATVDLLALLARRRTPARLLVLGTYRPGEMHGHHPVLQTVMVDLQRYGLATEIPLTELSPGAVAAYLAARFPQHQFPPAFAAWLHAHTDGNPLFLVTLVQAFLTQGMLQDQAGGWTVQENLATLTAAMPESLRQVLDQQITRLAPACQRVVEVASVAGVAFTATAVAAALDTAAEVVEAHCDALVTQQLLCSLGATTWPNGTVATRYAFRHALYQQAVYARLGAGRRVRLHQRLGACLEAAYGARVGEVAAELAEHWVQGQDPARAIHYLHRAVENAAQRYAYREVIVLLTRALPLLSALPKTPERTQQEIDIQMTLGAAWSADKGPAALEVEQIYARVRALCQEGSTTPQVFPALRGLVTFYNAQGALLTARALAEQLYQLVQHEATPLFHLEAHEVLGTTLFYQGDFVAAHRHLEQGMALLDPVAQRSRVRFYGIAPGVRCLALTALTLWYLGYPSQARQRGQDALEQAQALDHPHSLALTHFYMVFLQYCLRDVGALRRQVEALLTLASGHEFPIFRCEGLFWQGWSLALQGHGPAGIAQMCQGMATSLTLGQYIARPLYLMLLAEAAAHTCQEKAGVPLLAEALAACEASGRGDLCAEVYRLQGVLLLWCRSLLDTDQATTCFQQALALARRQHAKSWELRAATSLARLWQQQGKRAEAYELLAPIYGWFPEGFGTADLQEAQALLADLGG